MTAALQRNLFTKRWRKVVVPQREDTMHIALVAMLRWCIKPTVIFRHVPNGEHRDPRTAAKLKAMGVLPGSADLEFHWRDGTGRRVLHLELKVGKRPQSDAQVAFALAMRLLGDEYHVARTIDEAITILGNRGLILPNVEVGGEALAMTTKEQIAELLVRPRGEFTQRQRWLLEAVELLLQIELERDDYAPTADFAGSLDEAYRAIRKRKEAGGPGWTPKEPK